MKALITGSAGLVGRHMEAALLSRGWDVTGIDIKTGVDARDFFRRDTGRWDLVVHCAAHVGGRMDIEGRPAYLAAVNLQLDGALFEWALREHPGHIIYWSSSAAYPVHHQKSVACGRLSEQTINLRMPLPADATYGWVKLCGERLAVEAEAAGLRVHVFRPFSGYAEDQDLTYPFPSFIDRARRRADPFEVWGTGTQVRDWIHIEDVIAGALAAVELDYPGPLNLCSGTGTTFNRLAGFVCEAAGYRPVLQHHPDRPAGVHYRVGDPTEMLKVHTPRVSLREGVRLALTG